MIVLAILFCIVVALIIGLLLFIWNYSKDRSKSSPGPKTDPTRANTNLDRSAGFEPETAVFHCYENQNSSKLIRMKPNMERFDQFVKIMNASQTVHKNKMIVSPVYFTDAAGRKKTAAYELRMKVNVPNDAKTFSGRSYSINVLDHLSIMLFPIGNEDCEYDMTRHFGSGPDRLHKNALRIYVRHISKKSNYKSFYDKSSYWKQIFTIDDATDYSSLFKIKSADGTLVEFPSGDQDVHYKGIELPSDGTLEIHKVGETPVSLKTMNFIVRTTYAGYGKSNLDLYRGESPGPYPYSLDSTVVLDL